MEHSVAKIRQEYRRLDHVPSRVEFDTWMAELTSKDIRARRRGREGLVMMGEAAVAPLLQAMNGRDVDLRREAARTLCEISSVAMIPVWLDLLEDQDCDFRWFATKGLIAAGDGVIIPLLRDLEHRSGSILFRDGARRVLYHLAHGDLVTILVPVIRALEDVEPALEVIVAAYQALDALRQRAAILRSN